MKVSPTVVHKLRIQTRKKGYIPEVTVAMNQPTFSWLIRMETLAIERMK